jgi:putative tricarboxylic transport membrane protein
LILLFCLIGAYSLNNNIAQILFMIIFGFLGYLFKKFRYEAAPLVLALVLGPMLEKALRRSLLHSGGDPTVFLTRPISAILLSIAFCLLIFPLIPKLRKKKPAFAE